MKETYEKKYHLLEEDHWWFAARRDIIERLIGKANKKAKILEIGCSGGVLLKTLKDKGFTNLHGIDISKRAIALCKKHGLTHVNVMDGADPKFNDDAFDIIIASDVLEHIKNDDKALKEWRRILKPEGKLILFVPAFMMLWSEHDAANQHIRRYTKAELRKKLEKNRLREVRISYWNVILFFPVFLTRMINKVVARGKKSDQLYKINPLLNRTLRVLLKTENWFLNKVNAPLGVSIFTIAKKG